MKKVTRTQVWSYVESKGFKCYELEDAFNALGGTEDYDNNTLTIQL